MRFIKKEEANTMKKQTKAIIAILIALAIVAAGTVIYLNRDKLPFVNGGAPTAGQTEAKESTEVAEEPAVSDPQNDDMGKNGEIAEEQEEDDEEDETAARENEFLVIGDQRDIVRTVSPITFTEPQNVPEFYSELQIPGVQNTVYAFTDTDGAIQLRAYGICYELTNNVKGESHEGFWPVTVHTTVNGNRVFAETSAFPTADSANTVGTLTAESTGEVYVPSQYKETSIPGVYAAYTNNGQRVYRATAVIRSKAAVYPSDSSGNIPAGSIPVYVEEESTSLLNDVPAKFTDTDSLKYPAICSEQVVIVNP